MKIWFDAVTPKQVLFFESIIRRSSRHNLLCTTRRHREAAGLVKIRKMDYEFVGKYGGAARYDKLSANIERMRVLLPMVKKFDPDIVVSSCTPDASRIAFGLGINHIAFCNMNHAAIQMWLTVPFVQKLLIPGYMQKKLFTKYGINSSDIMQYSGMDEYLIIKNKPVPSNPLIRKRPGQKLVLFRTFETAASYFKKNVDMVSILKGLGSSLPDARILVLGRYEKQIRDIAGAVGERITVLDKVYDSTYLLSLCDLFVGSGGTMTSEAALHGLPVISYNAVPNESERYLVRKGLVRRAETPLSIGRMAKKLLSSDGMAQRRRAKKLVSKMEDPYRTFVRACSMLR